MKTALIISVCINIFLLAGFTVRRMQASRMQNLGNQKQVKDKQDWIDCRYNIMDLPLDSNDIVFIGTSLTEGFPVAEYFGAKNRGVGFSESKDILNHLKEVSKARQVFLEVGSNDVLNGVSMDSLLCRTQKILSVLSGKVYVEIVDNMDKIRPFNAKLKQYCIDESIPFTEINLEGLTCEGIHPNRKGYEVWRDSISRVVERSR
jgi:hypothetical protein